MERQVSEALREISEITLRAYIELTKAETVPVGLVLSILSEAAHNVYYATARNGAPGIPETEEASARLTLEAYVLPFGDDLLDAMVAEGKSRSEIPTTFALDLAETTAERVYAAGFRPTVQVFGAR